jgi:hypothetical protein
MKRMRTDLLLMAVFCLLLSSTGGLYAGAGCSQAGSYYTINIPEGWKVSSAGG